jgi:hypothetical protein
MPESMRVGVVDTGPLGGSLKQLGGRLIQARAPLVFQNLVKYPL